MLIMKDPNLAKRSRLQSGLQFSIGRVVPPHISGVNEFPTGHTLGIDDAKTIFRCGSERLLTEDRFSSTDRRQNKLAVCMIGRGNDDSMNIRTVDQFEWVGVYQGVDCSLSGSGRIRICYGD